MNDFAREERYVVFKIKDIVKYLHAVDREVISSISDRLSLLRKADGKRPLVSLVIESDWPEYEPAWSQIKARVVSEQTDKRNVAMLRAALVGLIGADSEQELKQMEATMRLLPAPEADKAVSINAIHALLSTMP